MRSIKMKHLLSTVGFALFATTTFGQQQTGIFIITDIQPGPDYHWPSYHLPGGGDSGAGRWTVQDGKFSTAGAAFFQANNAAFIGADPGRDEILEWSTNTTHVLIGTNKLKGFIFNSDPKYPLTFRLLDGKGYVYLCGRGTVTTKDGKMTRLGFDDSVDAWLPFIHSDDEMRAEAAAQSLGYLANTAELKDKAVPVLIDAARSKKSFVYWYACEALGRLGDNRALDVLRELEPKGKMIGALAIESRMNIEQQVAEVQAKTIVGLEKSGDMAGAKTIVVSIQDESLKQLVKEDVDKALKQ